MDITVCIGSSNPAKIKGVVNAFNLYFKVKKIKPYKVETGLPPQPIGLDTIIKGAQLRALKAFDHECDYSVGIEAGFHIIGEDIFDITASYIISKDGLESMGFSPSFPIPRKFYKLIEMREFKELEEIVDHVFGTKDIGEKGGFISILTMNVIDRAELSKLATLMALVKTLNKDLYSDR
ncbi:MAG: inosine/xanthosine triphosphatase [Desulfurococcaceae archaeon]